MPLPWSGLHHRLVRSSSSHRFQQQFDGLRASHAALQRFRDPPALLEYLHHGTDPPDRKNAVLRTLVWVAQGEEDNCALTLMLLALWPGLDAVRRRLIGRWHRAGSEPAADLLARTCEAIRTLNLDRVNWVAATVLRNVERDIGRQVRREADRNCLHAATDPDDLPSLAVFANPSMSGALFQQDLVRLCGRDAGLIMRVALIGQTQAEAGAALGLSETVARKRYQRASRRLQETLH